MSIRVEPDGIEENENRRDRAPLSRSSALTSEGERIRLPADVRARFLTTGRIYLGFSSCAIKDHVRGEITGEAMYRCLTFGHVSLDLPGRHIAGTAQEIMR